MQFILLDTMPQSALNLLPTAILAFGLQRFFEPIQGKLVPGALS
jgi:hypothetical protein